MELPNPGQSPSFESPQPSTVDPSSFGTPATGAVDPNAPGGKTRSFQQEVFDRVTKNKHEVMRSVEELRNENGSLRESLARIEGMLQGRQAQTGPVDDGSAPTIEKLTTAQIHQLLRENPQDPDIWTRGMTEINRRTIETVTEKKANEFRSQRQDEVEAQKWVQKTAIDFGPDSQNPNSALTQKAREYAQLFIKEYGPTVFEKSKPLYHHCYALADRELKNGQIDQYRSRVDQLEAAEKTRLEEQGVMAVDIEHEKKMDQMRARGDREGVLREHAMRILKMPIGGR